jgi:hypothetical protein
MGGHGHGRQIAACHLVTQERTEDIVTRLRNQGDAQLVSLT